MQDNSYSCLVVKFQVLLCLRTSAATALPTQLLRLRTSAQWPVSVSVSTQIARQYVSVFGTLAGMSLQCVQIALASAKSCGLSSALELGHKYKSRSISVQILAVSTIIFITQDLAVSTINLAAQILAVIMINSATQNLAVIMINFATQIRAVSTIIFITQNLAAITINVATQILAAIMMDFATQNMAVIMINLATCTQILAVNTINLTTQNLAVHTITLATQVLAAITITFATAALPSGSLCMQRRPEGLALAP